MQLFVPVNYGYFGGLKMTFNFMSPGYYIIFLPIVILFVEFYRKDLDKQIKILLLMSYLFFILASGWHLLLLIISTVVDWNAGNNIHKTSDENRRKRWLILSIVANLGILAIFKYLDFFISTLGWSTAKLGIGLEIEEVGLLLPVGISFYTFQTMSYTIDIYRGKEVPARNLSEFACYASFFPQLVAGPIVRFSQFRDQVSEPLGTGKVSNKIAVTLIIYGLAKKMIFADNFAFHVDSIFSEETGLNNPIIVYWGTLLFGLQIYCDFSAYTDIAIGSALLMGIKIPENFRSPYKSASPQEFWRRWHITLSTWLRDYLYISLGGNRFGVSRMFLALMTTMFFGGLWHGASWNFVFWGLFHGLLLVIHRYGKGLAINDYLKSNFVSFHWFLCWLLTQWSIFFGWLIFRVEDTTILFRTVKSYVIYDVEIGFSESMILLPGRNNLTFILLIVFIFGHIYSSRIDGSLKYHMSRIPGRYWGAMMGIILTFSLILRPMEATEFIYFRF